MDVRMRLMVVWLFAALLGLGCSPGAEGVGEPRTKGLVPVQGTVLMPVPGAYVHVYRPGDDLRGPPLTQLGPLGPEARFEVTLSPGEYVLVARRRESGDDTGPVRQGDVKADPIRVVVEAGKPLSVNLLAYIKAGNVKETFGAQEDWVSGISGQITDPEGAPVEGLRVHVYDHVQMSERPKFVSARTGPDGRYQLLLPRGGTYYVCARDQYGGPPKVGDLYGRYDQGTVEPSAVIVPEDAVLPGIDITVHTVW